MNKYHTNQSGQVLLFTLFIVLVLVLVVAITINMGHGVQKKIVTQTGTDAAVCSGAWLVARGLNYITVLNDVIITSHITIAVAILTAKVTGGASLAVIEKARKVAEVAAKAQDKVCKVMPVLIPAEVVKVASANIDNFGWASTMPVVPKFKVKRLGEGVMKGNTKYTDVRVDYEGSMREVSATERIFEGYSLEPIRNEDGTIIRWKKGPIYNESKKYGKYGLPMPMVRSEKETALLAFAYRRSEKLLFARDLFDKNHQSFPGMLAVAQARIYNGHPNEPTKSYSLILPNWSAKLMRVTGKALSENSGFLSEKGLNLETFVKMSSMLLAH